MDVGLLKSAGGLRESQSRATTAPTPMIYEHFGLEPNSAFCPSERRTVANGRVSKRILFVDDEAGIRLTLPCILAKYGFDVTSVANVEDAVAEIKVKRFDALLSDLNLLRANDGFVVISAMRRHQPRCVTFILTGYPGDASAAKAVDHEVAHYFTKPVEIEELVNTINEKLAATRMPGGVAGLKKKLGNS
jgi:two-component system, cell cycle response regulator CpdR